MKPAAFEYLRPRSLDEAIAALTTPNCTAVAMAGGQSLMPMLALRVAPADLIVDISHLKELKGVGASVEGHVIGAATTHAEIEDGKLRIVPRLYGEPDPMGRVASAIAYRAIRNHGTIGGSLALADPAADWPVALMALGASVNVMGPQGRRTELVSEFIRGIYATSLSPGEIIVDVIIPPNPSRKFGYAKVARKSGAFGDAIACASGHYPGKIVLGGSATPARVLPRASELFPNEAAGDNKRIDAIRADLDEIVPDADAYQRRLYTATILRAAREVWA